MKICRRHFWLGASATALSAFGVPAKAAPLGGALASPGQTGGSEFTTPKFTTPLTAYLTAPSLGISDAPLSATPVGGYKVTSNNDGSQLYFEYNIGTAIDNLALSMKGANNGGSIKNLDAHTIAIRDANAALVALFDLPSKQARTLWRFPWVTDKLVLSPKDLVTQRLMFAYGNPGGNHRLNVGAISPAVYNDPNSFASMVRAQGATGERAEIGFQPEWSAYFMATGDSNYMMQTAEAAGTCPVMYEDAATGKPFNKLIYPAANNYGTGPQYHGSPWVPATNSGYDNPLDISIGFNHAPDVSYIAALTTRNPWHLRNLQLWANAFMLGSGQVSKHGQSAPYLPADEQRLLAWGLRSFGTAYVATKEFERLGILPDNCLPSSYFETILLNTLKYLLEPWMKDPDLQVSRVFWKDGSGAFAPWQQCYIGEALAFLVLTGHSEFNAVYLWHLQGIINFCSGKTGWPPALPCMYWVYSGAGDKTPGAMVLPSMAAIYQMFITPKGSSFGGQLNDTLKPATLTALNSDSFNGGNLAQPDNQGDYFQSSRMCLAAATYMHDLGVLDVLTACPDLPDGFANLQKLTDNLDAAQKSQYHRWNFSWRNAVVTDASAAPRTIKQATQYPA